MLITASDAVRAEHQPQAGKAELLPATMRL